jgi:hypothetical protein
VRRLYRSVGRQEEVNEDSDIKDLPHRGAILVKRHSLSAWAAKNAYTLVFLSLMFFVTWILIFVFNLIYGAPHH